MENWFVELWLIMDFFNLGLFGFFECFCICYVILIEWYGYIELVEWLCVLMWFYILCWFKIDLVIIDDLLEKIEIK